MILTEEIEVEKLQPNTGQIPGLPKNPRFIKDDRYVKLKQSIQDNPEMLELRECIVYPQNGNYVVIAGNMRYRACRELGYRRLPCKVLSSDTPAKKLRAYVIKDNIAFGAEDWDALANEWEEQELVDFGLDISNLVSKTQAQEDDYEIPDEIHTDIKSGDLFQIGSHRLLCGDSASKDDVKRLMGGLTADMVFTDPPYGVSIGQKNRMLNSIFGTGGRNTNDINDDRLTPDELHDKLLPAFENLRSVMSDDCTVFVTAPQNGELGMMMMMMMKSAGLPVRHVLIWKKNQPTFSMGRLDYDYQHEPILLTWGKKHKYYGRGEHKTSVWEIDKPTKSKEHPTMKPVELVANALLNNSKDGDTIVDLYLGSGTTMVASHQLGRKCFGMEIEPKYCQVIIDRMCKLDQNLEVKKL